jgi:hypothetical protein
MTMTMTMTMKMSDLDMSCYTTKYSFYAVACV